jgi:hypothetical protein
MAALSSKEKGDIMQKMISKMATMFPIIILMGFMIVLAAFAVGYLNSQNAAAYFAETKAVRESTLLTERTSIESVGLWLPYAKFLGLGLILGGIVMALRKIIDGLKDAGMQVLDNLPAAKRPAQEAAPWYALLMPIVMMLGWVIFIYALLVSLQNAELATNVFSNPLATVDAAAAGSTLLDQLGSIHATSAWLVPLKFFGVATEFLAITMGLATITTILSRQTEMIKRGIEIGRGN